MISRRRKEREAPQLKTVRRCQTIVSDVHEWQRSYKLDSMVLAKLITGVSLSSRRDIAVCGRARRRGMNGGMDGEKEELL